MIEDAAASLIAERGYAETRLVDVAAAAGVTKQLVHRHFATKKELHLALLERHRAGVVGQIATGMAGAGDLRTRMRATLEGWFGYVEAHPFAARLLFRDTTGDPEIAAYHVVMQRSAREANMAVLRAEAGLDIPEEALEALAELIRSSTVALALWWADHPEVPRERVVDLALEFFSAGLAPWSSPRG